MTRAVSFARQAVPVSKTGDGALGENFHRASAHLNPGVGCVKVEIEGTPDRALIVEVDAAPGVRLSSSLIDVCPSRPTREGVYGH
jgi:hypothetical protein